MACEAKMFASLLYMDVQYWLQVIYCVFLACYYLIPLTVPGGSFLGPLLTWRKQILMPISIGVKQAVELVL